MYPKEEFEKVNARTLDFFAKYGCRGRFPQVYSDDDYRKMFAQFDKDYISLKEAWSKNEEINKLRLEYQRNRANS